MPRSRARCTQAMAASFCGPFEKLSQEPKAISETVSWLSPSWRYFIGGTSSHSRSSPEGRMQRYPNFTPVGNNRLTHGTRRGGDGRHDTLWGRGHGESSHGLLGVSMSLLIENYALVGDCHTAALVGSDGSIDWLCLPRFDSGACFAALLGGPEHGRWLLAPVTRPRGIRGGYRGDRLVLETEFDTEEGCVRVIDFMPLSSERWDIVRIVEGLSGRVSLRMELRVRFDYGSIVPWVHRSDGVLLLTAGPDTLELASSVAVEGENMQSVAQFCVSAGERESFVLNYRPSHVDTQAAIDAEHALTETTGLWHEWSGRCTYRGQWRDAVLPS